MTRRQMFRMILGGAGCGLAAGACRRSRPGALGVAASVPVGANSATIETLSRPQNADISIERWVHPASYYDQKEKKRIICRLCPRDCLVGDRERGYCGARENRGGEYFTLVYGQAATANVDPIEKKPFFHFLPGTRAFSIATAGCNMDCKACQNWEISQIRPEQVPRVVDLPPAKVAQAAVRAGAESIAYTYTEPVIFYEYMRDSCKEGHKQGVRSVMVSGGYIQEKPLREILPHLDAIKIDLKSFREDTYLEYCRSRLDHVLKAIQVVASTGKPLEIVYLVVPTVNDTEAEVREMCQWLIANVGPDVPLHFSRFFPHYQLQNLPPTPPATLERCYQVATKVGMHYVYVGNVADNRRLTTLCPGCKEALIRRSGFDVVENRLKSGVCPKCKHKVPGVWG